MSNELENTIAQQIIDLMELRPDCVKDLQYGQIEINVRANKIKMLKVIHSYDLEKMKESENGDA